MRKAVSFIVLILLCQFLTGCAPDIRPNAAEPDLIVVGFSQVGAESDWRKANTISMQTAFSSDNGYRLILDDAQQKQERQIVAIRNFINQGVDYITTNKPVELQKLLKK